MGLFISFRSAKAKLMTLVIRTRAFFLPINKVLMPGVDRML